MINKPPPFKGLNRRIPTIIPIKGRALLIRCLGYGHQERVSNLSTLFLLVGAKGKCGVTQSGELFSQRAAKPSTWALLFLLAFSRPCRRTLGVADISPFRLLLYLKGLRAGPPKLAPGWNCINKQNLNMLFIFLTGLKYNVC